MWNYFYWVLDWSHPERLFILRELMHKEILDLIRSYSFNLLQINMLLEVFPNNMILPRWKFILFSLKIFTPGGNIDWFSDQTILFVVKRSYKSINSVSFPCWDCLNTVGIIFRLRIALKTAFSECAHVMSETFCVVHCYILKQVLISGRDNLLLSLRKKTTAFYAI